MRKRLDLYFTAAQRSMHAQSLFAVGARTLETRTKQWPSARSVRETICHRPTTLRDQDTIAPPMRCTLK